MELARFGNQYLQIKVYSADIDIYRNLWSLYSPIIKSLDDVTLLNLFDDADFKAVFIDEDIQTSNTYIKDMPIYKVVNGGTYVDLYVPSVNNLIGAEKVLFKKLNVKVK